MANDLWALIGATDPSITEYFAKKALRHLPQVNVAMAGTNLYDILSMAVKHDYFLIILGDIVTEPDEEELDRRGIEHRADYDRVSDMCRGDPVKIHYAMKRIPREPERDPDPTIYHTPKDATKIIKMVKAVAPDTPICGYGYGERDARRFGAKYFVSSEKGVDGLFEILKECYEKTISLPVATL